MANRVPASPSLSPGRRLFRAVPQSPALAFRGTASAVAATPVSGGIPVGGSVSLIARHTKSTSDLSHGGPGLRSYDPSRGITGAPPPSAPCAVAGQSTALMSPRDPFAGVGIGSVMGSSTAVAGRPYTPYAPGAQHTMGFAGVQRSASPTSGSAPPLRQKYGNGVLSAPRGSSVERRPPQWGASAVSLDVNGQASSISSSWASSPRQPTEHVGGSPRPQTSRRAPSHPHLQGKPVLVAQDGNYEAQMSNLRTSLLQHIQSVQKEITRLQAERQRAQTGAQMGPHASQGSSLAAPTGQQLLGQGCVLLASGTAVPMATHQSMPLRAVSSDRGALPISQREQRQATVVPLEKPLVPESGSMPAALDGLTSGERASPAAPLMADVAQAAVLQHALSSPVQADKQPASARPRTQREAPIHHAACRIQRAWRVHKWRRQFVEFSEGIGWVGTLDWLQQQNLLYGTELADPEDVRWWMQQRAEAPLDHEVDPWGCGKLRDHLNKMWYGRTTEELLAQQAADQQAALQAQQQQQMQQQQEALLAEGRYEEVYGADYAAQLQQQQRHMLSSNGSGRQSQRQSHSQSHGRSAPSGVSSGHSATLRSPPPTDRTVGQRTSGMSGIVGNSKATSLSPRRDATWAHEAQQSSRARPISAVPQPGLSHMAGAALYQSPPQTRRATRQPVAGVQPGQAVASAVAPVAAAMHRPRSPVQTNRIHTSLAPSGQPRLSLPGVQQLRTMAAASASNGGAAAAGVRGGGVSGPVVGGLARLVSGSPQPTIMNVAVRR